MELAGLLLGILGAQPIIVTIYLLTKGRFGARRRIRFDSRGQLDIICTVGSESRSRWGSSAARRVLTPEGEVRGIAAISTAMGKWYARTAINVEMASRVVQECSHDLVILGGPSGNSYAEMVLNWPHLKDKIVVAPSSSTLCAGSYSAVGYDHRFSAGRPTRDLGVIVCTYNVWSRKEERRLILFAGLTTYGTGAAAQFFFTRMAERQGIDRSLAKELRRGRATVVVVEAEFNGGYLTGCNLLHWQSLDG